MRSIINRMRGNGVMEPVADICEIEFLVKEAEIVTGRSGRLFVIESADHLTYLVRSLLAGFLVQLLSESGKVLSVQFVLVEDFSWHSLGHAIQAKQLFTQAIGA